MWQLFLRKKTDKKQESTVKSQESIVKSFKKWTDVGHSIYNFYAATMKIAISVSMFIAFVFIAYQAGTDLFSDKIVIQPFIVPPAMEEKGIHWRCYRKPVDEPDG